MAANPINPEIAEAIRSGRKLEAIKLYRQAHGVGFKEAKDAVDAYEAATRGNLRSGAPKPAIHPGLLNVERAMNDEDTAILHRVILDSRHLAQSRTLHFEGGERVERAARIDLVRMGRCFYLLHYDKEGNELTDTCHDTVDEAMKQAEYEFDIKKQDWLRMALSGS
jgi:hypothetical protein